MNGERESAQELKREGRETAGRRRKRVCSRGGRRGDSIDRRERERGKRGLQYGSVIDCSLVDSP